MGLRFPSHLQQFCMPKEKNNFAKQNYLSEGLRTPQLNEKFGCNEVKPFTLCYTKCEAFCWFSLRSGKRSFSLKLVSAICP